MTVFLLIFVFEHDRKNLVHFIDLGSGNIMLETMKEFINIDLKKRLVSVFVLLLSVVWCWSLAAGQRIQVQTEVSHLMDYSDAAGMTEEFFPLKITLEEILAGQEGNWSIYVKDLKTGEELSMNHEKMYAASLIKLFVMEKTYQDYEEILENDMQYTKDLSKSQQKIVDTLSDMIQISDNEAFNELVRVQNQERSFSKGCVKINEWLKEKGYEDTAVYHTLEPSPTKEERISEEKNHTSARDCGKLLEAVYRNKAVSEEAPQDMLLLLTGQQRDDKIPAGVPEDTVVANKTGETDSCQHDAAIIYGPEKDYILCVMSENVSDVKAAAELIRSISAQVYTYLE